MGKLTCYLCKKNSTNHKELSFHKFPKDSGLCLKWKEACGVNTLNDVSGLRICSDHFHEDIKSNILCNGKPITKLASGSVPSILVPFPPQLSCVNNQEYSSTLTVSDNSQCLIDTSTNNDHLYTKNKEPFDDSTNNDNQFINSQGDLVPESLLNCGDIIRCSTPVSGFDEAQDEYSIDDSSNENYVPSKKRRRFEPLFIKEVELTDFDTPRRGNRTLKLIRTEAASAAKKICLLSKQNKYYKDKVQTYRQMIEHLKQNDLISRQMELSMMRLMSHEKEDLITILLNNQQKEYSDQVRSFALTLHFYSPKAYKYVRSKFNKQLPHPSTIRKWYEVVDGSPGFTKEALDTLELRGSAKPVTINIVIDEIAIKQEVHFNKFSGQFTGCIDFGNLEGAQVATTSEENSPEMAKNALVFMAVSMTENWKIPIGYFLVNGLCGSDRASLLKTALKLLHERKCNVYSVTFDGASTNYSMCEELGANFNYGTPYFKPFFENPATGEPCYVISDLCHNIKLVRNTLGDKQVLKTADGDVISWLFIKNLHDLQAEEQIRAANKLTNKHIDYKNNKMNVKLAMQTLSSSVHKALLYLRDHQDPLLQAKFHNCTATAVFCQNFNDIADMLNCKNRFSKQKFDCPLNDKNYITLQNHANFFIKYIGSLTDEWGTPILQSRRKTGFLGLVIDLINIFPLFNKLKSVGLSYVLTYKISQDYIETFFSAIRSRGGFNNNPNAEQFKTAYKRLLVRHELKEFENGNCLFDNINILHVSSRREHIKCPLGDYDKLRIDIERDHDYISITRILLSPLVEGTVLYIAGYVAHKLIKSVVECEICKKQLIGGEMPSLAKLKNRGPFVSPSEDVRNICKHSERIIREHRHNIFKKNLKAILANKIFNQVGFPFDNAIMNEHVLNQELFDNHRSQLIKYIIDFYLNVKLFDLGRQVSEKPVYYRAKWTNFIQFSGQ